MIYAVLDLDTVESREELHRQLRQILPLPAWYGDNLDALYDYLTDPEENLQLTLLHTQPFLTRLGHYGESFLHLLADVQQENPRFQVLFST